MKSIEHTEQVLLMQWWALAHQQFGIPEQLLFAIPNGGSETETFFDNYEDIYEHINTNIH